MKISVEGWLKYQLTQGGIIVQHGEQHNLMLNSGLDSMAAAGILGAVRWAAVGTGGAPASIEQTALGAESARTQDGPAQPTLTRIANGKYRYVVTREFTEGQANGNLTEWGMAAGGSGNIGVRELFRNGQGNPVVITKDSTQKLRLIYTLEVTVGPAVRTPAVMQFDGAPRNGSYVLAGVGDHAGDIQTLDFIMTGTQGNGMFGGLGNSMTISADVNLRNADYNLWRIAEGPISFPTGPAAPYVPGSFRRDGRLYTFNPDQFNGNVVAVMLNVNTDYYNRVGYVWTFDPGHEIKKTDLDRLTLTGPSVTWGRA